MKYKISKDGCYLKAKEDAHNKWYLPIYDDPEKDIPKIIELLTKQLNKVNSTDAFCKYGCPSPKELYCGCPTHGWLKAERR